MNPSTGPTPVAVEATVPSMRETQAPSPTRRDVTTRFRPGAPKPPGSGRQKGTVNRDRKVSIERILASADPIATLCTVASGQPLTLAPEPGADPKPIYPTLRDVLAAASKLLDKVLPDLKAVSMEATGNSVQINMAIGQSLRLAAEDKPAALGHETSDSGGRAPLIEAPQP